MEGLLLFYIFRRQSLCWSITFRVRDPLHAVQPCRGVRMHPMPGPGLWMMAAQCSSFMKTLNVITYFFMSKMYTSTFFLCRQVSLLLQSSGQMFLV